MPEEHEGRLDLWIGFSDMSKMPAPTWPLLKSGQADMFGDIPFGTDPRGRPVTSGLFEMNWLIGAAPGQGKTSTVRVLACAAALDPLCDMWIHELAGKGDLEPLAQGLPPVRLRAWTTRPSPTPPSRCGCSAPSWSAGRRVLKRLSTGAAGRTARSPASWPPGSRCGCARSWASSMSARTCSRTRSTAPQAAEDAAYVIRLGRAYGIILVLATQRPDAKMLARPRSAAT